MRKLFLFVLIIHNSVFAQKSLEVIEYPEEGKLCPDFILKNIKFYSKNKATLKDFRGKWLLLDFWNKSCGACVASFPHLSQIQKELGDKVQIMMVGIEDPEKKIELIYSRYRVKKKLLMPCAFDSAIATRFGYGSITPRSILIDDKGVVQCLTTTIHLDEMRAFLAGNHPILLRSRRMNEDLPEEVSQLIPFNDQRPFAIHGNGANDTDFLFRSILTTWKPKINAVIDDGSIFGNALWYHPRSFSLMGVSLAKLYFYAFLGTGIIGQDKYGEFSDKLILEIPDSSVFNFDYKTGKNVFCYSVDLPPSDAIMNSAWVNKMANRVMGIMQRDLQNYFRYVVTVETRKCPCWLLIVTGNGKENIKTKGGPQLIEGNYGFYFRGHNVPFKQIFNNMIKGLLEKEVIFDESGISGNIDISLDCKDCILSDVNDLKKALQGNGLDLVRSERDMKVIVIHNAVE